MFETQNLRPLLELLNVQSKRATELHCRDLVIYSADLASLILAGRTGLLGDYRYACHFDDRIPEHLSPTAAERDAIGREKVGPVVDPAAKKFLTKTGQTFVERKLFAAHLFYSPSYRHWHLFYFDQRDKAQHRNHWKHGSHIHYTSEMLMHNPLPEVWAKVQTDQARHLKGLHVRYVDHHHRSAKRNAGQA